MENTYCTWKCRIITAFFNECGENARWEVWRNFLQKTSGERFLMDGVGGLKLMLVWEFSK